MILNTSRLKLLFSHSDIILCLDGDACQGFNADTQQPYYYICGTAMGSCLRYLLTWEITNPDAAFEEELCNWDNYTIQRIDN
jgi:hypothetical protein